MKRTHETFWWSLFSGGGVVAAMVMPAMIFLTGLAAPYLGESAEAFSYASMKALLAQPLVKLFILGVVVLPLFHCVHRIRHVMCDIGLGIVKTRLALVFYAGALAGSVLCGVLLWRI